MTDYTTISETEQDGFTVRVVTTPDYDHRTDDDTHPTLTPWEDVEDRLELSALGPFPGVVQGEYYGVTHSEVARLAEAAGETTGAAWTETVATLARKMADGTYSFVGVIATASRAGVELGSASLWGVACDWSERAQANAYIREVGDELVEEAVEEARRKVAELAEPTPEAGDMGTSDGLGADPLSRFTILCRAEGWAITFDALPFQTFRSPLSVDETAAIADATAKAREMIAADREAAEPYGGDDDAETEAERRAQHPPTPDSTRDLKWCLGRIGYLESQLAAVAPFATRPRGLGAGPASADTLWEIVKAHLSDYQRMLEDEEGDDAMDRADVVSELLSQLERAGH